MKYVIDTFVTPETGEIHQRLNVLLQNKMNEVNRWVIDTRDEQVRSALKQLGWQPPVVENMIKREQQGKRRTTMEEKVTASEAVYGFAAWLTCRRQAITIGTTHDAASVANLVKQWCDTNNLPPPRDGVYPDNITQPNR